LKTSRNIFLQGLESLASVLFPLHCLICKSPVDAFKNSAVCSQCWSKIKPLPDSLCARCGYPFPFYPESSAMTLCGPCRRNYYYFDFARAVSIFEDPLREIIHAFKYQKRLSLSRPLGLRLAETYHGMAAQFDAAGVVPVPLYPSRKRERGFNQAEALARHFCRSVNLPLLGKSLRRIRPTLIQAGLSRRGRRLNMKGAFCVKSPEILRGKKILLMDDVFTTGATLNECSRILKEAGVAQVSVLTLARVVR
jgi:ComF family protein